MRLSLLLVVLLSTAVCACGSVQAIDRTTAEPLSTTLDAVSADIAGFNNKVVRLTGQIDRCQNWSCQICPEEAAPAQPMRNRCLSIDWDRPDRVPRSLFDFDAAYRYASVDLVARVDQSCIIRACLDRAPVLVKARVLRILNRRPSALGLGNGAERDRLVDAPPKVQSELADLLANGEQRGQNNLEYHAYAYKSDATAASHGVICRSYGKEDAAKWPLDATALMAPSAEDRFRCFLADRQTGRWFIHPE